MQTAIRLSKKKQSILLVLLLSLFFCYLMVWVFTIPFNGAPDEALRYLVPRYIYETWSLPTGYDPAVIYHEGYYSYAFYPQLLGAVVSAAFMRLGDLVVFEKVALIYWARLTSVFSGLGVSYVLGRTSYRLTSSFAVRLLTMTLVVAWPQLTFLSAYLNNDIIGLLGTAILVEGMIIIWKEQDWRLRDTFWVALGYIVCLLGYANTYPLVLFSGLYFLVMLVRCQRQKGKSIFWIFNHCLLLLVLLLTLAFPFFLRNYLLYQDWLGNQVFEARNQEWLREGNPPTLFPYQGGNFLAMVMSLPFWKSTMESFIGVFGYMSIVMSPLDYAIYRGFMLLGLVFSGVTSIWRLVTKTIDWDRILLGLTLVGSSLLTIGLVLYRGFKVDYQAQGRYIIVLIVPLFLTAVTGYSKLLCKLPKWLRVMLSVLLMVCVLAQSLSVYQKYIYYPYIELGLTR